MDEKSRQELQKGRVARRAVLEARKWAYARQKMKEAGVLAKEDDPAHGR